MMWLIIFVLVLFRWYLLERFIGTINMFLLDAVMFSVLAALNFAQPGPYPWLGYAIGCLCIWWGFSSCRTYLRYDKMKETEDEQGRSDE
jgi:Na+/melibiose symporter-like transporter